MRRKFGKYLSALTGALYIVAGCCALTSCLEGDDDSTAKKYAEWREKNEKFVAEAEAKMENGARYYTRIEPSWAPEAFSLVHWHNDRSLTEKNLSPLDNSTVEITYELFDIEGNRIGDSFANIDSIYRSRPSQNILGVWAPLTHMHIGDSVTIVLPSQSGYGERSYGSIQPYSALVYNIKMKAIPAYEVE